MCNPKFSEQKGFDGISIQMLEKWHKNVSRFNAGHTLSKHLNNNPNKKIKITSVKNK